MGSALEKLAGKNKTAANALKIPSTINAIPAVLFASLMIGSAKVFSYTQKLIWGGFVAKPVGDKINTRVAQYGATDQPGKDLKCIAKALFTPKKLAKEDWTLNEWKRVSI